MRWEGLQPFPGRRGRERAVSDSSHRPALQEGTSSNAKSSVRAEHGDPETGLWGRHRLQLGQTRGHMSDSPCKRQRAEDLGKGIDMPVEWPAFGQTMQREMIQKHNYQRVDDRSPWTRGFRKILLSFLYCFPKSLRWPSSLCQLCHEGKGGGGGLGERGVRRRKGREAMWNCS